ncbi:hypothetical protein OG888_37310 [Streptomyces sp. NBC_00622]
MCLDVGNPRNNGDRVQLRQCLGNVNQVLSWYGDKLVIRNTR